ELLIGATVERAGFQRAVTAEGIAGLLRAAIELAPSLRDLPIARTWCGFRPWAPDGLPILGPWPGIEGLWVSTAPFRNGILLAPLPRTDSTTGAVRERLKRLEHRGLIRRGTGGRPAWLGRHRPVRLRGSVLRDLLRERETGW